MGRKNRRKKEYAKPIRAYKYVNPKHLDENSDRYLDDYIGQPEYFDRSAYKTQYLNSPHTPHTYHSYQKPVYHPHRGEIWFVRLGYHDGSSVQNGTRPALIISNDRANRTAGTFTVIPMTTHIKKLEMQTHVMLGARFCEKNEESSGELFESSMLLVEQITTIGQEALLGKLGRVVDEDKMKEIERAVEAQVGISQKDSSEAVSDQAVTSNQVVNSVTSNQAVNSVTSNQAVNSVIN